MMRIFGCGVLVSVVYFFGLGITIHVLDLNQMTSWNEFGDFLAGAFSPVAFFWLVLGYLQQQKELQQNTEALKLQATELKNSVEQYKEMVSVSKQQLENESIKAMTERLEREKEMKPDLYMLNLGWSVKSGEQYEYNWSVFSDGKTAKNISLTFDPPIGEYSSHFFRSSNGAIKLPKNKINAGDVPEHFRVVLTYESILGYSYESEYHYEHDMNGMYNLIDSADYQRTKI
ncbi:TPA: hypothetical protein KKM49_003311 [Escherichia coli]|nr:hypothetical protein [Escherichia coli]